jgi:hypothetical protein
MKTDRFTATIGVTPGYSHDNEVAISLAEFAGLWQQAATETLEEVGVYPVAVLSTATAVYPGIAGCPPEGEAVFVIMGVRNPAYVPEPWHHAVAWAVEKLRLHLDQVTAQIAFDIVEMAYLVSENDAPVKPLRLPKTVPAPGPRGDDWTEFDGGVDGG